jgi:20S proteasome subunit alpha 5
VISHKVYLL